MPSLIRAGIRIPRVEPTSDEQWEENLLFMAQQFAGNGLTSKVAKSLKSSPSAPANRDTFDKLITFHPQREIPTVSVVSQNSPRLTLNVSNKSILSAIKNSARL